MKSTDWSRIADDLRVTSGHELALRFRDSNVPLNFIDVSLDGRLLGSLAFGGLGDSESMLALLADELQEFALHEEIGGGWPTCPEHGTHPLVPV